MSNCCFSCFHIEGSDVSRFHQLIDSKTDYYDIVVNCGLLDEEGNPTVSCRGNITSYEYEDGSIYFNTETAWSALPEIWFAIREKFSLNVEISYYSEESGMGYFEKHDSTGVFADCEYFVDFYCENDEDEEFLSSFRTFYEDGSTRSEEDVREFLSCFLNLEESDDNETYELIEWFYSEVDNKKKDENTFVRIEQYVEVFEV